MNEVEAVRGAVELVERKGDRIGAIAILTPLAEAGNAEAQLNLARMYVGLHVNAMWQSLATPQTAAEADRWFTAATEQGNPYAAYERAAFHEETLRHQIGAKYEEVGYPAREAVQQEYRDAVRRLENAITPGDAHFPYLLGQAYLFGNGVAPSIEKSKYWFMVAFVEGANGAADVLRSLFAQTGRIGLEKGEIEDCLKAIYWLRKSREHHAQCTWDENWEQLMVARGLLKPEELSTAQSRSNLRNQDAEKCETIASVAQHYSRQIFGLSNAKRCVSSRRGGPCERRHHERILACGGG